jgi:phospholipase C
VKARAVLAVALLAAAACTSNKPGPQTTPTASTTQGPPTSTAKGIHKIEHVVVIMQENRSFDSSFGTFPGADRIPMKNGKPIVCMPNPATSKCVKPFHDPNDINTGGPHRFPDAVGDIDGGKMDGFISQLLKPEGAG